MAHAAPVPSWFDSSTTDPQAVRSEDSQEMLRQWHGFMTARLLLGLVLVTLQTALYFTGTSHSKTQIGISAAYLFGTLLDIAGAGNFMLQMSLALLGHLRGGPAKVAVVSSALNGVVSGSSVSNVEQILRDVMPTSQEEITPQSIGIAVTLPKGSVILAADDSPMARSMIEQGLKAMGAPYIMTKTGQEAWDRLQAISEEARAEGKTVQDKVALVLTDLEMPVMDGFTLTRNIKQDQRFKSIPVVIHSSLTGTANEGHVKTVGADAYVAKFVAKELASTIRQVLTH